MTRRAAASPPSLRPSPAARRLPPSGGRIGGDRPRGRSWPRACPARGPGARPLDRRPRGKAASASPRSKAARSSERFTRLAGGPSASPPTRSTASAVTVTGSQCSGARSRSGSGRPGTRIRRREEPLVRRGRPPAGHLPPPRSFSRRWIFLERGELVLLGDRTVRGGRGAVDERNRPGDRAAVRSSAFEATHRGPRRRRWPPSSIRPHRLDLGTRRILDQWEMRRAFEGCGIEVRAGFRPNGPRGPLEGAVPRTTSRPTEPIGRDPVPDPPDSLVGSGFRHAFDDQELAPLGNWPLPWSRAESSGNSRRNELKKSQRLFHRTGSPQPGTVPRFCQSLRPSPITSGAAARRTKGNCPTPFLDQRRRAVPV